MNTLRRVGLGLAVFVFSSGISLIALFIGLYAVFETSEPLKAALQTSGIYSVTTQDTTTLPGVTPTLPEGTDPGIQQAFANAFPPGFVQHSSEQAIDSIYSWVHGNTSSPDFSIDITPVKTNFANNVAAYVQQKLDGLPPCTEPSVLPVSATDAAHLTCRPANISTASLAEQARQEVLANQLVTGSNSIDSSAFKDADGRPLSNQLSYIPELHHYYIISLYILPILTILCAVAIVFWSSTKRVGTKRIAWMLVGIGGTNALFSLVGIWLLQVGTTFVDTTAASTQDKIFAVLKILAIDVSGWWIGFGVGYVVLGIGLLVFLKSTKPPRETALNQSVQTSIQKPSS
jgi:hypothetical protein